MCLRVRMFRGVVLAVAVIALMACASTRPKAVATAEPAAKPAGQQGYRFYMTQHGKRMTADDFDAWMKANGLQVRNGKMVRAASGAKSTKVAGTAGGRPTANTKANATSKAGAKAKASGTSTVTRTIAKPKAKAKATPAKGAAEKVASTAATTRKDG